MKKLIVVALLLLSQGVTYALPVGNPAEASLLTLSTFLPDRCYNPCEPCFCWFDVWSLRVGYYGDFIFNRNLKVRGNEPSPGEVIQKTEVYTNAGYLALNIAEKLDVFATLGATSISILTNDASWFILGNELSTLKWQTTFSWSLGARATLFTWRCWLLGAEGQFLQTNPRLTQFVNGGGVPTYFNQKNEMVYKDWQAAIGVTYAAQPRCSNFGIFPYAAVKWGWGRLNTRNFTFVETTSGEDFTIANLKPSKIWGYAIGATIIFFERLSATVEGRFANEKAFYVNGQLRF